MSRIFLYLFCFSFAVGTVPAADVTLPPTIPSTTTFGPANTTSSNSAGTTVQSPAVATVKTGRLILNNFKVASGAGFKCQLVPYFPTAPTASPSPVTAKTTTLYVTPVQWYLGENTVTYAWTKKSGPGTVTFTSGAALPDLRKTWTATFSLSGAYVLTVTATGADGSANYYDVSVTVNATKTDVAVTSLPSPASTVRGGLVTFTGTSRDQFGTALSDQPPIAWSVAPTSAGTFLSQGDYLLEASGADIWGTNDGFRFVHQEMIGDGTITAKVEYLENTNAWAKAGVMIRDGVADNAVNAMANVTAASGALFQRRLTVGATSSNNITTGLTAPYWVRLTRVGNVLTGFASPDGSTWTQLGTDTVTMSPTVRVGLAVTSHQAGVRAQARFSNVSITPGVATAGALPSGWTQQDINITTPVGSGTYTPSTGTYTIQAAGADIWGTSDQFRFVHRPLPAGDVTLIARVASLASTHASAKAGLMIRDGLGADAINVLVNVTPGTGGVAFQRRTSVAGSTLSTAVSGLGLARWVKLTRVGASMTAYTSGDGKSWRTIGSTSVTMGTTLYAGLAVTSHNATTLTTAVFDNVQILTGTSANALATPQWPWQTQDIGTIVLAGSAYTATAPGVFWANQAQLPGGPYTVTATATGVPTAGTASVTITNGTPIISIAAKSSASPVTGTSTVLSAYGDDDAGEPGLTYTWTTTGTPPATPTYSVNTSNAAKTTTATFTKAGTYTFRVTATDANGAVSAPSDVTVTVNQTATSVVLASSPVVLPVPVQVITNTTQQFSAVLRDQFTAAMAVQPDAATGWTWSVPAAAGTVSTTGLFTASATVNGPYTLSATAIASAKTGNIQVSVVAPPVITIAATDATATEFSSPADNGTFTITRSGITTVPVTVNLAITGSAGNGGDYTTIPTTVTIPANATTATVNVTPINDTTPEVNETVIATVAAGSGYTVGSPAAATVTLIDDEQRVTIAATDATASEPADTGTFTVTRTGTTAAALSVAFTVSGTATSVDDYQVLTSPVVIPAGALSTTITVTPVDNTTGELAETVIVTLTTNAAYTIVTGSATVTINDNDAVVTIAATDATAIESATATDTGTFTISRSGATTAALTVNLTTSGTASATADFTPLPTAVTIPAGSASTTVTVTPVDNTTAEPNKTVILTVATGTGYTPGTPNAATVTIIDDEQGVSIAATDATASEATTITDTGTFTITRTGVTTNPLTVNLTTSGTASSGTDYTALPASVVIAAGASTATVVATPINDAPGEPNETIILTVAAGTGYTVSTPSAATVTLVDDDQYVTIAATDATASEPGTDKGTFTITRSGLTTAALTVNFTVSGSTVAGDYTSIGTSATINAGATTATITVTPIDDAAYEGSETVIVTLAANAAYTIGTPNAATVTINDNDLPTITIAATDASAAEPSNNGVFTLTRSGITTGTLTVNVTKGGSTSAGDHNALPTTVTFSVNQATATVTLTPTNDAELESTETATLTIATGTGYNVGSPSAATVTLLDDEQGITITATDATASETSGDTGTFTITRTSGVPTPALTVNLAAPTGSAGSGDFSALPTTVAFAANQTTATVTLTAIDDTESEPDETVTLAIAPGTGYLLGTPSSATITIKDNDAPVSPSFTTHPTNQTVTMPGMATFTSLATGNPTPTYQWSKSTNGGTTWTVISGATNANYTTPATTAADHGTRFRVVASNGVGTAPTSNVATLTVLYKPVIGTHPANQTVTAPAMATFSVSATGNPATLSYQWSKSTNGGGTWTAISGATAASYTTPATAPADNGAQFRVAVTNTAGTTNSNAATLTVLYAPVIGTHPANQTVTVPATAAFSVSATGNPATLSYQWSKSTNGGGTWTAISGATAAGYTTPATALSDSGAQFRVVVTNSVGPTTSTAAVLTVMASNLPFFVLQPKDMTVTVGQQGFFNVEVTSAAPVSYQWRQSVDGGTTWSNIAGQTSNTLLTSAVVLGDNGKRFKVVATNSYGSVDSAVAVMTVESPRAPTITKHPSAVVAFVGQSATFSVWATGTDLLTYQWQKSVNGGGTWTNIVGATAPDVTLLNVQVADAGSRYRAVVTNGVGQATSNSALLAVSVPNPPPIPDPPVVWDDVIDVEVEVTDYRTGSNDEVIDGITHLYSKPGAGGEKTVTVTATASPASGFVIDSVTIIAEGVQEVLPGAGGSKQITLPEGTYDLKVAVAAHNDDTSGQKVVDTKKRLIIDGKPPGLSMLLSKKMLPLPAYREAGRSEYPLVTTDDKQIWANNMSETGWNGIIRGKFGRPIYNHADISAGLIAAIPDLVGLDKREPTVAVSVKAKEEGNAQAALITLQAQVLDDAPTSTDPDKPDESSSTKQRIRITGIDEAHLEAEKPYAILIKLKDKAGNESEEFNPVVVTIDKTAPTVPYGCESYQTSPFQFVYPYADETLSLVWQGSVDGSNMKPPLRPAAAISSPYLGWILDTEIAVSSSNIYKAPSSPYGWGSASSVFTICDLAGNKATPTLTINAQTVGEGYMSYVTGIPSALYRPTISPAFSYVLYDQNTDGGDDGHGPYPMGAASVSNLYAIFGTKKTQSPYDYTFTSGTNYSSYQAMWNEVYPPSGSNPSDRNAGNQVAPLFPWSSPTNTNQLKVGPPIIQISPSWKPVIASGSPYAREVGITEQPVSLASSVGEIYLTNQTTRQEPQDANKAGGALRRELLPSRDHTKAGFGDLRYVYMTPYDSGASLLSIKSATSYQNVSQKSTSTKSSLFSTRAVSGSTDYSNTGPYWMGAAKVTPDVTCSGDRKTIRIEAGFYNDQHPIADFSPTGDYVHFVIGTANGGVQQDMTVKVADYPSKTDDELKDKIAIVSQRLIFPEGNPYRRQILELDLEIGPEVPAKLYSVDVKLGAVHEYTDAKSVDYRGANGAFRLVQALANVRLTIKDIVVGQMEAVRIEDFITFEAPQLTAQETQQLMDQWLIELPPGNNIFMLRDDVSAFKSYGTLVDSTLDGSVAKTTAIFLGGNIVHGELDSEPRPFTGDVFIRTDNIADSMGIEGVLANITVNPAVAQVETIYDVNGFTRSPIGISSLLGRPGKVTFRELATGINIKPGTPGADGTGQNTKYAVKVDGSVTSDLGQQCARITKWTSGVEFFVTGDYPGTTVFEVHPIIDGQESAEVICDIPVAIELPALSEPSMLQLDTAKARAETRRNTTDENFEEVATPPSEDGNGNPLLAMPSSHSPLYPFAGIVAPTDSIKRLDATYEQAMFVAGQILPHPSSGAGKIMEPFDTAQNSNAVFTWPTVNDAYELSLATMISLLTDGKDSTLSHIANKIAQSPAIDLWRRYHNKITQGSDTTPEFRGAADGLQQEKRALEIRAKTLLQLAAAARLKRYYSITIDGEDANSVDNISGFPSGPHGKHLPMTGEENQVILIPEVSDLTSSLRNYLGLTGLPQLLKGSPASFQWHYGHPLTEDLVTHMIAERADLSDTAAKLMRPRAWSTQYQVHWALGSNPPAELQNATVEMHKDGDSWWWARLYGASGNFLGWSHCIAQSGPVCGWVSYDGSRYYLQRIEGKNNTALAFAYAQDEIYRLMMAYNHRKYADFWTQYGNQNPNGIFALVIGDAIFGITDMFQAYTGTDLVSGEKLSRGQRAFSMVMTALMVVPADTLILKGAVKLLKSAKNTLSASSKALHANAAAMGAGSEAERAFKQIADAGDDTVVTQAARQAPTGTPSAPGVGGSARRPGSFVSVGWDAVRNVFRGNLTISEIWRFHHGCDKLLNHVPVVKGATRTETGMFRPLANAGKRVVGAVTSLKHMARNASDLVRNFAENQQFIDEMLEAYGRTEGLAKLEKLRRIACFTGETPVAMADGSWRPISEVRVGDYVKTRSQFRVDAELKAGRVTEVFRHRTNRLCVLRLAGMREGQPLVTTIRTTDGHPFWRVGEGWTPAVSLESGDRVQGEHGTWTVLESTQEPVPATVVCNLEIDIDSTYFVGGADGTDAIWVHNVCREQRVLYRFLLANPGSYDGRRKAAQVAAEAFEKMERGEALGIPGVIIKGDGGKLGRSLGPAKFEFAEAHHLISSNVVEEPGRISDMFRRIGFDCNHASNGKWLPSKRRVRGATTLTVHNGGHPGYREALKEHFDAIAIMAGTKGDKWAIQKIKETQDLIRKKLGRGTPLDLPNSLGGTSEVKRKWDAILAEIPL